MLVLPSDGGTGKTPRGETAHSDGGHAGETAAGSLTGRLPALIESGELESAVGLPMNKRNQPCDAVRQSTMMVRDTQQLLKETRQMTKHLRRRPGHMTAEHYW